MMAAWKVLATAPFLLRRAGAAAGREDGCESQRRPASSRCFGCPPMLDGKLCASTTRYDDQTKAACGCGPSDPVPKNWWSMTKFNAALNCKSLDSDDPRLTWCPSQCGSCYRLCTTGGTTQGDGQAPPGECEVFKVTNRCGDGYDGGSPNWCSQQMSWRECQDSPGECKKTGSTNMFGYPAHFDLMDFSHQITELEWDNVEVTFEPVSCTLWTGPAWDCECPAVAPSSAEQPPQASSHASRRDGANPDSVLSRVPDATSNASHGALGPPLQGVGQLRGAAPPATAPSAAPSGP